MIESKRFGSKKALVDIDETICFYSDKRVYELAEPNFENIAKINQLTKKITNWSLLRQDCTLSTSERHDFPDCNVL